MKLFFTLLTTLFFSNNLLAQKWQEPLDKIISNVEADAELKHGIISLCIMDANTGEVVYMHNAEQGLPTASTQKVITSIAAFEALGSKFKYETKFYKTKNGIHIQGSYDPTLGSHRYQSTNPENLLEIINKKLGTVPSNYKVTGNTNIYSGNGISDGWIYEDLGNYYGAACNKINWKENQYDATIVANNNETIIKNCKPFWVSKYYKFINRITVSAKEEGDNTCLYNSPFTNIVIAKGTIGKELPSLEVSGSIDGAQYFCGSLQTAIQEITNNEKIWMITEQQKPSGELFHTHTSPALDSIIFWFLKKSINLYGESLLRTIAEKQSKNDSYENGIVYIHTLCKKLNIDTAAVHLFDGCGLSPQNRITTKALSTFLQYAYKKDYFKALYNGLPIINNLSMKSGSIHGTRAYAGYVNSSDNNAYTFAIVAHNYDGSGKAMQAKLWKILDVLK